MKNTEKYSQQESTKWKDKPSTTEIAYRSTSLYDYNQHPNIKIQTYGGHMITVLSK